MMKAGEYYIGDLCYVFEHDEWDKLLEITDYQDGEFTLPDGRCFAIYSTAYGDGLYQASNGDALGVDSGTIGCILVQDIHRKTSITSGTLVQFDTDFGTGADGGKMKFGHILINTAAEEEECNDDMNTDSDDYSEDDDTEDDTAYNADYALAIDDDDN